MDEVQNYLQYDTNATKNDTNTAIRLLANYNSLFTKLDNFLVKESSLFVVIAIYFSNSIFSLTRVTKSVNWGRFSSCTPLM